jgi:hypothetical protein
MKQKFFSQYNYFIEFKESFEISKDSLSQFRTKESWNHPGFFKNGSVTQQIPFGWIRKIPVTNWGLHVKLAEKIAHLVLVHVIHFSNHVLTFRLNLCCGLFICIGLI